MIRNIHECKNDELHFPYGEYSIKSLNGLRGSHLVCMYSPKTSAKHRVSNYLAVGKLVVVFHCALKVPQDDDNPAHRRASLPLANAVENVMRAKQ